MTINNMAFTPVDGLKNVSSFPTVPADEAAARKQIQDVLDQIQTYLNNTLTAGVNAHLAELATDASPPHGMGLAAAQDYEEGTWTPGYAPSSGAFGAITYSAQVGSYVRIGNIVHVSGFVATSNLSIGTATGDLKITGLPFALSGVIGDLSIGLFDRFDFTTVPSVVRAAITSNYIKISIASPNDSNNTNMSVSDLLEGALTFKNQIQFSGTYEI